MLPCDKEISIISLKYRLFENAGGTFLKKHNIQSDKHIQIIKAGLEIFTFINKKIRLKLPMFIDNAECITQCEEFELQVSMAKVMKDVLLIMVPGT